jgi:folate-binding protein YgfZ
MFPSPRPGDRIPAAEYDAARSGAVVVSLDRHGLLATLGPQRQGFLQGLLSNDVAARRPGQGCRAALLTAKGGILALVRVLILEDAVLLETPPQRLELVRRTLEHYRVAAPVRFEPREATVLALVGPRSGDVLGAATGSPLPHEPEDHMEAVIAGQSTRVVRATDLPLAGFVLHVPHEGAPALTAALEAAGAPSARRDTLDVLRVEAVRPWYGSDVGDENLLHETGLLAEYHSAAKGCYVGQEVVARLEARGGNVSRRIRGLRLVAPASSGETIRAREREVGRITTAAVSPRFGPVALGYVHRDHCAPGTSVLVGDAPAVVVTSFEERVP